MKDTVKEVKKDITKEGKKNTMQMQSDKPRAFGAEYKVTKPGKTRG